MPKVYDGKLTNMFDISGKKAAIFGGAGGFGKAIAEGFAANGADVLILSRREEALKAAAEEIKAVAAEGVQVKYYACDACVEEEVIAARDFMVSEEGRLPEWLQFLSSPEPASLSLLWQLLVVEFLIDVLKLSSLNTPDSLSNSFSLIFRHIV